MDSIRSMVVMAMVGVLCSCGPPATSAAEGLSDGSEVDGDTDSSEIPATDADSLELVSIGTWGRAGGFGGEGAGSDEFSYPSGIALSPDESTIYVFDSNNERIKALTTEGSIVRMWGHPGRTCGGASSGIAVSPSGLIYIANDKIHGVSAYEPNGDLRYEWGLEGVEGYCRYSGHMHDFAFNDDGHVAVTEPGLGQVQVFTSSGDFVLSFGSNGEEKGQFHWGGAGIAFRDQRYIVSDSDQILVFDKAGNFLREISPPPGERFVGVTSLNQEWNGWLFLAASDAPATFYALVPESDVVRYRWQVPRGNFPGELDSPFDAAIDSTGRWFVSELYNHRVQVLQGPKP